MECALDFTVNRRYGNLGRRGRKRGTGQRRVEKPELARCFHEAQNGNFNLRLWADAESKNNLLCYLPLDTPLMQIYLPVCKDGGVVTLEAAVDQLLRAGGVDGVLLGVHVEHVVVCKGLVFSQDDLRLSGHHVGADVTSLYLFSGQLRTDPEENKDSRHVYYDSGVKSMLRPSPTATEDP